MTTHGGEPLLAFKEIQYFVKNAKKRFPNIYLQMTTNATLLDAQKIDFIEKNYNKISISIDGNQKSHDANRVFMDGSGTYNTVMNNYKKLKNGILNLKQE